MKKPFNVSLVLGVLLASAAPAAKNKQDAAVSAIDTYAREADQVAQDQPATPGSIWTPGAQFADLGRDLRASQVNDLVTILVAEQASAVSSGASQSSRNSSVSASVSSLAGLKSPASALSNLAKASGTSDLKGSGTTSRQTTLSTTISARVIKVLPNGYLVLEGTKSIQVNSESQVISVRGIVRPADLAHDNSVPSDRLAQLDVRLNGRGVVGDAIRRPNFLYRLIMGILPI